MGELSPEEIAAMCESAWRAWHRPYTAPKVRGNLRATLHETGTAATVCLLDDEDALHYMIAPLDYQELMGQEIDFDSLERIEL